MADDNALKKFSSAQLLNFCIGFFGLQFAWQMRIILSGPLTESLGASPLLYGLIWLAGPVTGIVVQPIIGALSDNTFTKFGRRIPYLFFGALFGALGLILLPKSQFLAGLFGDNHPAWLALFIAAIFIWMIDACVNAAQGPYRALVPDNIPKNQHAIANSFLSFAIGLGSVVAAGTAPFLNWAFHYQMSVDAQFTMAGVAFVLGMLWTCITFREVIPNKEALMEKKLEAKKTASKPFVENVKEFLPKNISKDNIKDMVYHALGNTIVEDKSKFIKGVNLTDEHAQVIVDILYNIVHKNENVEEIDNVSLKDINVTIGFYDATEENVRKFMFKKKQPTDEEVKNALNQLTAGDVDAKILAIEIKDEK